MNENPSLTLPDNVTSASFASVTVTSVISYPDKAKTLNETVSSLSAFSGKPVAKAKSFPSKEIAFFVSTSTGLSGFVPSSLLPLLVLQPVSARVVAANKTNNFLFIYCTFFLVGSYSPTF